ncbi:ead/Ea22-like family protein [Enterobacter hormaechei]|uniref:ead/Ea22-like family protein n=1 Tax=Enterobacter hormaechei TaxID=158836 RepID=UPI0023E3AEE7|nr:ead/Ea22-like family protein [Enterobacter hormaechei]MCE1280850.1 ead/Ea22-like family protein [Enterobacter hormaechei]MCE1380116.1 ead/Ea22-like family protein [Enterobacter hormaechei]MDF3600649.1 ead/Ea22-like family protein [Enterobacter hormaechei]
MSNINKQELREAAENATPGRIGDRVDGSIKYTCRGTDGALVLSTDNHDDYGFVGDNSLEDELFFRLCDPATVLALLDELEAKDKSISFLKDQFAQLENFNPDWDKLEAATYSLREHMAELTAARKRIAELEAREVVLPSTQDVHPLGPQSAKIFCEFHRSIVNRCADEIRKVGVKVSIKGD